MATKEEPNLLPSERAAMNARLKGKDSYIALLEGQLQAMQARHDEERGLWEDWHAVSSRLAVERPYEPRPDSIIVSIPRPTLEAINGLLPGVLPIPATRDGQVRAYVLEPPSPEDMSAAKRKATAIIPLLKLFRLPERKREGWL